MRRIALFCLLALSFTLAVAGERTLAQLPLNAGASKIAATGGCSQATNFLARTSGSPNTSAITTMVCNLVTQGVFAKLDVFGIYAIDIAGNALLNVVSSSFSGTANGSPTFTANAGYTGVDGSTTVYIDTGFNPSTAGGNFTQNAGHVSAWSNTNTTAGASGGTVIGLATSGFTNFSEIIPKYSDGNGYYRLNTSAAASPSAANANSTGHYVSNRSTSSNTQGYKNASSVGTSTTDTSIALANGNFATLARNQLGLTPAFGSAIQVMTFTIGGSLSGGDVTNLCHEQNVYLTTVAGVSGGIC